MEQLWRQAPMPAVRVRDGAGAPGWELNDAARQWLAASGLAPAEFEQWIAGLHSPGDADRLFGHPVAQRVRCRTIALDDGRLIWLVPEAAPRAGPEHDRELIERALYMSDVSVWWVDSELRNIHFIRRGALALGNSGDVFKVPLADHRGQMHPDDVQAVARAAQQAMSSDRVADAMVRYALPEGGFRTLLTRRVAQRDADGRLLGLLGISIDLSDLAAERERSLRLSDRMRLAAETIGLGFWSRAVGDGPVDWDDQMYRLHHRPPSEGPPSLDEWLERHVHALDRDWMRERQQQSYAQWPPVDDLMFRIPVPGSDEVRWIHARTRRVERDGRRVSFGVHVDVTEQEIARLALAGERERLGFVLEAAGVGVWERRLDGRPSYLSDVGYRLRGREPSPLPMEEVIAESADPADFAAGEAALRRDIERGETYRHEYRVRWPDGELRWLASFGRAVRDSAGRVLYVAGIDIDITERRNAEAVARERLRAEQASRAKTEFLARMSHELRTPLNAVLGFATLLMHDRDEPPSVRQQERLARIETAGRKLLLMIDEVLDLAGDDSTAAPLLFEPLPLDELAADAVQRAQAAAREAGVELRLAARPLEGLVTSDRLRLSRVIDQLIDNAVRFNWPGGIVELRSWAEERADAPGWVLALRDTGRGMSAEQLKAAFEPFQRLGVEQEAIDGPGIGLAIVRRYVERLRGQIDVDSRPGRGSEFRIWLPQAPLPAIAAPPLLPESPRAAAPRPAATPALRVLAVEDNPVNLLLLREVFGMRPALAVELCEDGGSAIERAAAFTPEVVLLDLQLPDMTGVEVMQRLRADPRHARCRYIALSANAMPDDVQAARDAGFDDYWTKPIDVRRFLAAIDQLVVGFAAAPG
ncbi:PAS domain-containing protein [Aquincola sp. S2]|uniref:histidine kinase n=1 Tax=Pseudaquabacterium terrae TaxID=2732868 RepID=A0ABX2EQE2_9BURK|nr:PAS domain-containing hybrid sensor histidine kinase/response regulator [Aquabacterium terrae]NRF70894.1 PAS domain-containing protein [Aquabacterium terrae]